MLGGLGAGKIIVSVLLIVVIISGIGATQISLDSDSRPVAEELLGETAPLNGDTDGDGLLDGEEVNTYHTNPTSVDTDGDGLNDREEVKSYGTDPTSADSDADGLSDSQEVSSATSPLEGDTDSDGLQDGVEVNKHSTDPVKADTDGDDLRDGPEVNQFGSSPVNTDTDGDGLQDGEEVNSYGTDPTKSDSDTDGLSDSQEVDEYGTEPLNPDTDEDGLQDGEEVNSVGTDPSDSDSDSDGLQDGAEVNKHNTNPLKADTDGDRLSDGEEVNQQGTDPTMSDTDSDTLDDYREVNQLSSSPTKLDSDGDKLSDGAEIEIGTKLSVADTDGDGFWDGVEVSTETGYVGQDGDPLHKDVFVEVDVTSGNSGLSQEGINGLIRAFESAPVANPDNTEGISLHLYEGTSTVDVKDQMTLQTYYTEYYTKSGIYGTRGQGFFHALILGDVEPGSKNVVGVTSRSMDGLLVEQQSSGVTGSTFMHELGHQLGLTNSVYSGIDTREQSWESYPSVMNYNAPTYCSSFWVFEYNCDQVDSSVYQFASGSGYNDWEYIESNLAKNQASSTQLRNAIDVVRRSEVE